MSAKKFLEILDRNGLLEDAIMAELRKQVADGKGKVGAETIAKALVDKGHLTKFQATKLVGEATAEDEVETSAAKKPDDDILGLAPFEDEEQPTTPAKTPKTSSKPFKTKPKKEDIVMLEDADALTPVEDAGAGLTPVGLTPIGAPQLIPETVGMTHGLEPIGGGLSALDAPDPFAAPGSNGLKPSGPIVSPKKRETRWDTKLMLGGFGTLALLIFLFFVLGTWLWSEPSQKLWEAAEEAYNGGNFNDAKDKYQKYLAQVGEEDVNSSKARVRLHLCKIRNDVSDPERGMKTVEETLPKIDVEKDASFARDEFPGLLPQIPEGFVNRAKQAKSTQDAEALVGKAKQARELLNAPGVMTSDGRQKIQPQLKLIDEDIALLERGIAQDKELVQTIADMKGAVEAGDTIKAYQFFTVLLKKYPGLKNDAGLLDAVNQVTARERTLVKVKQENLAPQATDEARKSDFRVVLATRMIGDAKLQNQVATLLYGNSAYALDAGTGHILWSRHLGPASRANPVRVSPQADADILLVDSQRHELLRVKATDGKLAWRLPIGESFTEPSVAGTHVFVATESGRLLDIDVETGESTRHTVIQQRLTISPVISPDRPRIYQIGEHSNIYVINSESLQCEDVIYLGHKAGSIATPPLILMGHVFVAENPGVDYALVHALKIRVQGEGQKLFPTQDPIRTSGRVVVPLVPYGRRLLVLTDLGEIQVFDVDSTKPQDTLVQAGRQTSTLKTPHVGYPLPDGNTVWVADDKLTKYSVQVTKKEINRDPTITNVGDAFVAPLQLFGNHLIHARRVAGSTGVTVTCIHVDDPRKTVWQTRLGVPAGRISVDAAKKEIIAISSAASLFQINGQVLKDGYADQPLQSVATENEGLSFTDAIEFPNGVVGFFNPADNKQFLVYDPAIPASRLKLVPIDLASGKATCLPVEFLGGLAVPTDAGEIRLFKVADGGPLAMPFQPKLEAGEKLNWRRPAIVGNGRELVIADERRNIYRVGLKDQPQPHLAELVSNRLDVDLVTGLAAIGETVYGVTRTDKGDQVVAITGSDLKIAQQFDLKGGRVTWGPQRVGDFVMVGIDAKELRLFDANQKERWEKPAVLHGNPAGPPLVVGESYFFAGVQGAVWGIASATGQEIGSTDLGEPLGSGPIAFQERLLLCGNDGTLHVIRAPTGTPSAATASTNGGP